MKNTICTFCLLLFSMVAFSQGWQRLYGTPDESELAYGLVETPDGGFLLTIGGTVGDDGFLLKISPEGFEDWSKPLHAINGSLILRSTLSGYFISGTLNSNDEPVLIEVDLLGNIIWEKPDVGIDPRSWIALPDGFVNFFADVPNEVELIKVSNTGDLLWNINVNVPGLIPGAGITATADGGFAIGGHNGSNALVAKFNNNGDLEWSAEGNTIGNEGGNGSIAQTIDGGYVVVADLSGSDNKPSVNKFSASGTPEWVGFPQGIQTYYINSIAGTSDGGVIMAGRADGAFDRAFLLKYSISGDFEFFKAYDTSVENGYFLKVIETSSGQYCAAGSGATTTNSGDAYIILANANGGGTFSNAIRGTVFYDENMDCLPNNDQPLSGWRVKANGGATHYDLTDSLGYYFIELDTGEYTLEVFPPTDLWSPCQNLVTVELAALGDTALIDFPIQAAIECPAMQVDISRPFFRRCFDNTIWVQYCNLGTVPAENASIEVTLDSLFEFVSSTIPPSGQMGFTYTFPLGDVGVNECGSFQITAFVNCDAVLGESLCMEAHAFPDSICGMPFNWSGASMVARAKCQGDTTVLLELENVGSVPTSQPLEYIVIEDQIIFLQGEQVFDPMQVATFSEPANGSTYRIICEQEPNHPGFSFPTAFVEGCGTNSVNTFSTGFLNEHPMADGDGFVDIDCEEVVASFDPNDKMGYPIGYDDQHYIEPNTDIEYRIRFQNTGTDTAFTVVIRDTLSQFLDPTTLRPGASSHPYEFDLLGNGVAMFRFPNIMLPDSNVNEALSHGFVSFKISQQRDLAPSEVIYNSAAIYFDFNEPIITNETFHTIEKDFIIAAIDEPNEWGVEVNIYPNPFAESATFDLKDFDNQSLTLKLFDGIGHLTRAEKFAGSQLVFQRKGLPSGIWFFLIEAEGQAVASGKLIVVGH